MVLALWMEKFPSQSPKSSFKTVGVIFVLPNDRVLAADCSRDDVHGVARVMINHSGKLEGCKVFVSRFFRMCQTPRTVESFPCVLPSNRTRIRKPEGIGKSR